MSYMDEIPCCWNDFAILYFNFLLNIFRAKLRRANVDFLSVPINEGTTGTVIVLTTPDAQRTMLAYQVSFLFDRPSQEYFNFSPQQT